VWARYGTRRPACTDARGEVTHGVAIRRRVGGWWVPSGGAQRLFGHQPRAGPLVIPKNLGTTTRFANTRGSGRGGTLVATAQPLRVLGCLARSRNQGPVVPPSQKKKAGGTKPCKQTQTDRTRGRVWVGGGGQRERRIVAGQVAYPAPRRAAVNHTSTATGRQRINARRGCLRPFSDCPVPAADSLRGPNGWIRTAKTIRLWRGHPRPLGWIRAAMETHGTRSSRYYQPRRETGAGPLDTTTSATPKPSSSPPQRGGSRGDARGGLHGLRACFRLRACSDVGRPGAGVGWPRWGGGRGLVGDVGGRGGRGGGVVGAVVGGGRRPV